MDEVESERHSDGAPREHLVWHQELICRGEHCRGRVRRFPPGKLVDGGAYERRRCPVCGTVHLAPAFYLVTGRSGHRSR